MVAMASRGQHVTACSRMQQSSNHVCNDSAYVGTEVDAVPGDAPLRDELPVRQQVESFSAERHSDLLSGWITSSHV